jgi:hypothetical protein
MKKWEPSFIGITKGHLQLDEAKQSIAVITEIIEVEQLPKAIQELDSKFLSFSWTNSSIIIAIASVHYHSMIIAKHSKDLLNFAHLHFHY